MSVGSTVVCSSAEAFQSQRFSPTNPAQNSISTDLDAAIRNAQVTTRAGDIKIQAVEDARIDATSVAASLAAASGAIGIALSGAGAESTNDIDARVKAHADDSVLRSTGKVDIDVDDDVIRESVVARGGDVVNNRVREALGLAPLPEPEPPALAVDTVDSTNTALVSPGRRTPSLYHW